MKLLMVAALMSATPAICQTARSIIPEAEKLVHFAVQATPDGSSAGRRQVTEAFGDYCHAVLAKMPTNTPREDEWVASEAKTTDVAKVQRLTLSREYNRREMKKVFSSCIKSIEEISQLQSTSERNERVARREAAEFISMAIDFNQSVDFYASHADLKPDMLGLDFLPAIRRALLLAALHAMGDQ
jgi:hypothetical protein